MTSPSELDLAPLRAAIDRLDEGLVRFETDVSDEQIRDGLIQRFEFTYEVATGMLRRYLALSAADPSAFDVASFQTVIREASRQGLLKGEWAEWRVYREMRARSSYTIAEEPALQVVAAIPGFLAEARHLLSRLQSRA